MPGKGRKGNKEKKPKDTDDKLAAVDRTFFEITITDLNNKLARLRSHNAKLEETNDELMEKIRKLDEDKTDITAFLNRKLAEEFDTIKEMDERLTELSKVRDDENKESAQKIKDWELKYKAMHEQLTSEIKLLNGKLNSLEEFRVQKDELMAKFDEQETELKEQQRQHRDLLYDMERKIILDKNALKKDVENKLLKLSDEFTRTSQVRIAAYTQRLIRENIALNNEMDRMIHKQQQVHEENREMIARTNELKEMFQTSETTQARLMKTCQNQIQVIEKLTTQFENLKDRYDKIKHFKNQYENILKKDICEKFTVNDVYKKLSVMSQKVEMVKAEKQKLIAIHIQHEAEILRLREVLKNVTFSIQSAIRAEKGGRSTSPGVRGRTSNEIDDVAVDHITDDSIDHSSMNKAFRDAQRENLLFELIKIVTSYKEDLALKPSLNKMSSASSLYIPGGAGLMSRSASSLLELFKREAKKIASAELISPEFQQKVANGKITPQPRRTEGPNVFDVESGSAFVVSSLHDKSDFDDDDEMDDESGADVPAAASPAAGKLSSSIRATETVGKIPSQLSKSESLIRDDVEQQTGGSDEDDVQLIY